MSTNLSHEGARLAGRRRVSVTGGLLVGAAAMILAACGGSSGTTSTGAPPATSSPASAAPAAQPAPASGPTVKTAMSAKFGTILVDAKGLALYTTNKDTATTTGCTGTCLTFWPPLLLPSGMSKPLAGPGVSGLGVFKRGSSLQVTYHGKPLYTWEKDTPGQVTGNGVTDSGGTWSVVTLGGSTSSGAGSSSATSPPTTAAPSSGGASF